MNPLKMFSCDIGHSHGLRSRQSMLIYLLRAKLLPMKLKTYAR